MRGWVTRHVLQVGRVLAIAAVVAAMALYFGGHLMVPQLVTLLAASVVCVIVLTVSPSDLGAILARVQKVSFGGFSAELRAAQAEAVADTPRGFEQDDDAGRATTIVELRFKLERKLTYLAKHVLAIAAGPAQAATQLSVGSLAYDGLLTRSEAILADTILTTSDGEFRALRADQRGALLRDGGTFVANVRAAVFHAYVASILERQHGRVARVQEVGSARDALVVESGGTTIRYITVFSTIGPGGKLVDRQLRRAAELPGETVVLLPSLEPSAAGPSSNGPRVQTLGDLLTLCGAIS